MNSKPYSQEWFEDGQIDEVAFCENFLQRMPLKCINGIFFSYDGMLLDSEVEKEIYRMVKPVLTKGISKKVKQLLEVLKLEAYSEELPVQMDRIHVNNGTYFLNGDFTEKKEFCLNRFPALASFIVSRYIGTCLRTDCRIRHKPRRAKYTEYKP